ncbi:YeeE/YedE family protein [Cutibacterium sp. WCA-380-WT-3A]|uniref:YeeE/YedE family protein n=1 Tax=Cutibacterium porci TaxID=2605781 RepID=A0A7K0J765_9ACTN|nr:YeeE/YedE family protein [Cutibacterium porci]MSS45683.1 YeeE/YedE family protein [Cutibacterium porci]
MILTGLLVGIAFGFVLQRGRFCVTNAFRQVWVAKSTTWMTAFLLVIAIQAVGVTTLIQLGVIHLSWKPLPWLGVIVGGLLFGVSIVLAGGCATGTWFRSGEGLVGSWIALVFYAVGAAAMKYGALVGVNNSVRSFKAPVTTIPALGISPWIPTIVLAVVVGILVWRQLRQPARKVATLAPEKTGIAHLLFEAKWHPFITAALISVIAIITYPLSEATGRHAGLGITTPTGNLLEWAVTGHASYIDWGVLLVVGILVGSYIAAKASGEFRIRVPDAAQVVRSIAGGLGMGIGASWAGGCTIGNAMVETAQFSFQGWISFLFMFLGVGLGTKVFVIGFTGRTSPLGTLSSTTVAEGVS